jgi:triosephosphate isomerase (TIM)
MHPERTPLLAANWKENQLWNDCERFIAGMRKSCPDYFDPEADVELEVAIFPPFPYIGLLGGLLDEANIYVGAQDVSRYGGGAYTGEVSAKMIADTGCDYAIIGHSERRHVMGETDKVMVEKLAFALEAELIPVLCVGEPLEEREDGKAQSYTLGQLEAVKTVLKKTDPGGIVIAYEPVWAIGTGRNAEPKDALEMVQAIRGWLKKNINAETAKLTQILYGGSVKPENIANYLKLEDIDGALIGGASLKVDSFTAMIKACNALLPL